MSGLWRHAYPFLIIASSCTKNLISTHGLRLLERVFKCTRYWWEQIIIQHIWSYNRGKRTMQQLPLNVKVCCLFHFIISLQNSYQTYREYCKYSNRLHIYQGQSNNQPPPLPRTDWHTNVWRKVCKHPLHLHNIKNRLTFLCM